MRLPCCEVALVIGSRWPVVGGRWSPGSLSFYMEFGADDYRPPATGHRLPLIRNNSKLEKHRLFRLFLRVMRTTLNLSGRPFANHRMLYIAIAAVLLISLWLYLWTISERGL